MRFLSFGAGVQTTALLLMDSYDEVIFADTAGENPETYDYLKKHIGPYVKENKIKFTVVKNKNWEGLEDYCIKTKHFPSLSFRWCTRDFKVRPIRYYLQKSVSDLPAQCVMGISCDEVGRMRTDHPTEFTYSYPLVDKGMSRKDCEKIIESKGFPIPPKSGCFYCPYMPKKHLRLLHDNHPDLWQRRKDMEMKSKAFPRAHISAYGTSQELEEMFGEGNMKMEDFNEEVCDAGYCMV